MYKDLTEEELIRVANVFSNEKKWEKVNPEHKWQGHDLVSEDYIFQLSYMGTIYIYIRDTGSNMNMDIEHEDLIRKELHKTMLSKIMDF